MPPAKFVTTYTVLNNSDQPIPVGTAYIAGQAFRRGDLPLGTHPVFRDPSTHAPLVQQLDEIATYRENGDDGSIRHLAFSVQLPAIPAHGTYTMEIVKQAGSYALPPSKQSLARLCAAHDLKLDLTDVRNQSGTPRGTGHMVSRVCDNINNIGRDAPRHVAQGPVRDTYIVRGPPMYTGGAKDPLIYVEWTLDLTTASDQTSLGSVRHVAFVMNPWMNVSDPQVVSYRPQLLDGASNLLDWSWYDATIAAGTNPILTNGSPSSPCGNASLGMNGEWTIPGSMGANAWYHSMAVLYHTDGTPPAGMVNDRIYFVSAVGSQYTNADPNSGKHVHLGRVPTICTSAVPEIVPTNQGAGDQKFAFRIWHSKWNGWYTWAQDAKENWTNGTARTVSSLYPAFTTAEKRYWEETGSILPFKANPTTDFTFNYLDYNLPYYSPLGIQNMGGGTSGGERAQLGTQSDWMARAFVTERPAEWDLARLAASAMGSEPYGVLRDEITGRIPIYNNGPPAANHGGGGVYKEGNTTFPNHPGTIDIFGGTNMDGLTVPLQATPEPGYFNYSSGYFTQDGNDHVASFTNGWYQIHGGRAALDAVYTVADRSVPAVSTDDLIAFHQTSTINGVRFYGLHNSCCQIRGAFWAHRDKTIGAAYGADANVERQYFNDMLVENYWHWRAVEGYVGGNFNSVFTTPYYEVNPSTFKNVYGHITMVQSYTLLRDPLSAYFIPRFVQEHLTRCSDTVPGSYSSYYCGGFNWIGNIADASHVKDDAVVAPYSPGAGKYFVNDASEYGEATDYWCVNTSAPDILVPQGGPRALVSNGDKVKNPQSLVPEAVLGDPPDQLSDRVFWYTVSGVVKDASGSAVSFKITDPTTGVPFSGYTRNGVATASCFYLKLRPTDPADSRPNGVFSTYSDYSFAAIKMLLTLGHEEIRPAYDRMVARGLIDRPGTPKLTFDENIRVH